jgi:hypothetical protein
MPISRTVWRKVPHVNFKYKSTDQGETFPMGGSGPNLPAVAGQGWLEGGSAPVQIFKNFQLLA